MFDVTITTHKRPDMVVKAIASCLRQGPLLQQVIVADDASGDETAETIAALADRRVRYIAHPENRGIGATRGTALDLSTAPWVIQLDSDQELLPGALEALAARIRTAPEGVGIVGSRYRWDHGRVTPKTIPDAPIDYVGRIAACEIPNGIGTDYLCCLSRDARSKVRWMPLRSGLVDTLFQLDAARVTNAVFMPDCLAFEKSDGAEGHTRGPAANRLRRRALDARDAMTVAREVLSRHGPALHEHGPRTLCNVLSTGATAAILAGDRRQAVEWATQALKTGIRRARSASILAAALAGPGAYRLAYRIRG